VGARQRPRRRARCPIPHRRRDPQQRSRHQRPLRIRKRAGPRPGAGRRAALIREDTMSHYTAPLRDMKFALYDVIGAEALYARLGLENATRDLLDAVMDEAAKFAGQVLAPL